MSGDYDKFIAKENKVKELQGEQTALLADQVKVAKRDRPIDPEREARRAARKANH